MSGHIVSEDTDGKLERYVRGEGLLAPDFKLRHLALAWLVTSLALEVGKRRSPKLPATPASSVYSPSISRFRLGIYGVLGAELFALHSINSMMEQVKSNRDLGEVARVGRQQGQAWLKAEALPVSAKLTYPDRDLAQPGLPPPPGEGLSYLAWKIRGHVFLDDRVWRHFYHTLALHYAEQYPDITAADWDVCVTHFSSAVLADRTLKPLFGIAKTCGLVFFGTTLLHTVMAFAWTSRPRIVILGLNGIARAAVYGFSCLVTMPLLPLVLHYRRPLQLQDKARVAEMLREVYPDVE
ncbi:uncharacterized protein TRAVEDRAFT_26185 [Trametes versicolor FP-101664 SS1]|uniref:uncharacterized protein n=1 Tax=Trametes versicolor (strain FP-101664) TaxID=717944 RepID=UPI0004621761|nr:uncharacterized protein TRAVEDRAFT_26185 [Trametes versicolor FP-101664 SS1]EIW65377.1 hypothetical protein TRAVEDRAFT_26185 [Trametes versicolor FP-101664 SS1]